MGLSVKLPFATVAELIAGYGANLTRGGIYLRSRSVRPPGTPVTLELRLSGGERLLWARAVVHFTTGQEGQGHPGMGLRFLEVDRPTRAFLDSLVAARPASDQAVPPLPAGVGPAFTGPSPVPGRTSAVPPPASTPVAPPAGSAGAPAAVPTLSPVAPPPATPPTLAPQAPLRSNAPRVTNTSGKHHAVVQGTATLRAPPFVPPDGDPVRSGPIIGIDLGTSNSCAAIVRDGKPSIIRTREGYNTVPSIVALNARGKLVVGHPAKGQMLTNPRQTVYGSKRLVGRAYDSEIVQEFKSYFHYEIVSGEGGEAAVQLGDRVYSLQQIAALGLREVRELAQNQLGQPISRAVITVPAYYNDNQRQAVREAGRLAGLYVERILNEPTAAALAYGYGRQLNQRVLVYDLGGGTFDASVLELHDNVYEVVSTGGDTFLGGIDFDGAIVGDLLEAFEKTTGHAFQGDRVAMQRITDAAERAKCALSERSEIRVHVPFVTMIDNKPHDLDVVLRRDRLIELTSQLVERTLQTCADVLRAKGLTPADVDEVILVGGQSRSPLVHQKVAQFFGRTASKGVHPDEAVALGAALFAHSLGQVEGVVLIDVLPMTIGVGLPGGRFKPVLEHNTPLPASKRYEISTTRDRQEELEVVVFQGEGLMASENEYLGTLKLTGLPPLPRGEVQVTVTFEVSNESLLTVKAREASTGREVESVFTTRDTPEAIRARLAALTPAPEDPAPPLTVPAAGAGGSTLAPEVAEAVVAAERNGLFGWIKRLFSR